MTLSLVYQDFSNDKHRFFEQATGVVKRKGRHKDQEVKEVRAQANEKARTNYYFLAQNRILIEQEFNQLFAVLKENEQTRDEFWLYCYYCCRMLYQYNLAYDKKDKAQFYKTQAKLIKQRYKTGQLPAPVVEGSFVDTLQQQIANDLGVLVSTPKHISKIRDWIGFANIWRILLVFYLIAIKQSLLLVRELKWLDSLVGLFGKKIDIDAMMSTINAPAVVFNALSVGLFAARFIVNAAMLLKHTFVPSSEEMTVERKQRFYLELKKRYCDFLNDAAWGTVNGLTNFSKLTGLSAPVVNGLMVGFLSFDIALLTYRRYLAKQDYLAKKEQYESEKKNIDVLMSAVELSLCERQGYEERQRILDEQLKWLEISWLSTNATYLFNTAAAALLMSGFSASLLLAACPAAVLACYMVCTVAIAMYMTADLFGKYREQSLRLAQARQDKKDTTVLQLELGDARNKFIWAMVKNNIMPLLMITTFAVCWEAALILTVLYIGYESLKGYFIKPKQPALSTRSAATCTNISSNGHSFLARPRLQEEHEDPESIDSPESYAGLPSPA